MPEVLLLFVPVAEELLLLVPLLNEFFLSSTTRILNIKRLQYPDDMILAQKYNVSVNRFLPKAQCRQYPQFYNLYESGCDFLSVRGSPKSDLYNLYSWLHPFRG